MILLKILSNSTPKMQVLAGTLTALRGELKASQTYQRDEEGPFSLITFR